MPGDNLTEFETIRSELRLLSDPEKADFLPRFFKTGPGEYGEGDLFLGVVVPKIRKAAKEHPHASKQDVLKLLDSVYHEDRLAALFILVEQYRRGDEQTKKNIFDLYLANTSQINNWDLVDLTAQHIVGDYLSERRRTILTKLACSKNLWERRIAILSTYCFIRRGESKETLRISKLLLHDSHDLIHKAVGWMLREVGNRCSLADECKFLDKYASTMPRTMLRYAIERFPADLRSHYMQAGKSFKTNLKER
jgi:3-methyladenine DNA glycosylase AlkD